MTIPTYEREDDYNNAAFNYAVDLFAWANDLQNALDWKWKRLALLQKGAN